ncbi:hypothetical protein HPP92_022565 [Vanilla planifolia]|uniref:Gnk2-homologous domain-containing protein n=1 Tax=Vanilla planifolia TaxID=51239 RepID=A0A835PXQ0_VANPL|nr:hypothetical protein HPP92_022823 [Vanilla planifolia]KAG0459437.1 hypothetical protein HPP92_022565 [Vanilla planifolia]
MPTKVLSMEKTRSTVSHSVEETFNNSKGCSECVMTAAQKLQAHCVNAASNKIWYFCSIRFDSNNFFGTADVSITRTYRNVKTADDQEAFHDTVWQLLEWVKMSAATKSNRFGIGKINIASQDLTIYGMAQCTQDISGLACIGCLTQMSSNSRQGCPYQIGCVAVTGSCRLRYEAHNFIFTAEVPLFPADQHTAPAPAP